jgi:hypothetical protein
MIVAGAALAIGHVVWTVWFSGLPIGEFRLYDRAIDGGTVPARAIDIRLTPDMNPVVMMLTGEIADVPSAAPQLLSAGFDARLTRDGAPVWEGAVVLAISPGDRQSRPSIPTGTPIITIPTPTAGTYQLSLNPRPKPSGSVMRLAVSVRRNVAPVSWAVVASGGFLALIGVMALRQSRRRTGALPSPSDE